MLSTELFFHFVFHRAVVLALIITRCAPLANKATPSTLSTSKYVLLEVPWYNARYNPHAVINLELLVLHVLQW
jgi:hypothetical protein